MSSAVPRPEILTIHPYVAGKSEVPGANRTVKLSSNEGAFGVPPSAQAAIAQAAAESHRYPDGGAGSYAPHSASVGGWIPTGSSAARVRTTSCINSVCPMAAQGATSSCRRMDFPSTTSPAPMPAAV